MAQALNDREIEAQQAGDGGDRAAMGSPWQLRAKRCRQVSHLTERLIEMEQRLEREADARRKIQATGSTGLHVSPLSYHIISYHKNITKDSNIAAADAFINIILYRILLMQYILAPYPVEIEASRGFVDKWTTTIDSCTIAVRQNWTRAF